MKLPAYLWIMPMGYMYITDYLHVHILCMYIIIIVWTPLHTMSSALLWLRLYLFIVFKAVPRQWELVHEPTHCIFAHINLILVYNYSITYNVYTPFLLFFLLVYYKTDTSRMQNMFIQFCLVVLLIEMYMIVCYTTMSCFPFLHVFSTSFKLLMRLSSLRWWLTSWLVHVWLNLRP